MGPERTFGQGKDFDGSAVNSFGRGCRASTQGTRNYNRLVLDFNASSGSAAAYPPDN